MPVKHFSTIQFKHEEIGFCEESLILYCFIWKWEDHLFVYVGRNFTENDTGNSTAFERLGKQLSNYGGKTKTHSIFFKYPELQKMDFEIKMLKITDEKLNDVEKDVIRSLNSDEKPKPLIEEIIHNFIGIHARDKIFVLNGPKKRLLSEPS